MTLRIKFRQVINFKRDFKTVAVSNDRKHIESELRLKPEHKPIGTFGSLTTVKNEDKYFEVKEALNKDRLVTKDNEPLIIIFGWAGATHKNLSKYSDVYRKLGCRTLQYILPTRFIFKHTEQVHEAVNDVATYLVKEAETPKVIHCLSDTGCMSFQGLSISTSMQDASFLPSGIVWDSCPGPRPRVTIPKGLVLCIINWMSRMRDGMSMSEAVSSSWDDFYTLAWKNYLRRMGGQEALISTMNGTWTGFWAKDLECRLPEMFLYSKSDFYIPYKYLESEVLPARKARAASLRVKRWDNSPHVGHLRKNKLEYEHEIEQFLLQLKLIK